MGLGRDFLIGLAPETNDGVYQKPFHYYKYKNGRPENDVKEVELASGNGARGVKSGLRVRGRAGGRQKKDEKQENWNEIPTVTADPGSLHTLYF